MAVYHESLTLFLSFFVLPFITHQANSIFNFMNDISANFIQDQFVTYFLPGIKSRNLKSKDLRKKIAQKYSEFIIVQ